MEHLTEVESSFLVVNNSWLINILTASIKRYSHMKVLSNMIFFYPSIDEHKFQYYI